MQPSLNRHVLVLLILSTGALVAPGRAGAETYLFAQHQDPILEASLLPAEPVVTTSPSTFRAIELELGLTYPPLKQDAGEQGSEATLGPEAPESLADVPPLSPSSPMAEALPTLHAGGPAYEVPDRPEVHAFVERFQTGYRRAVVERWLARAGRYVDMIRDVLRQRGLPEELFCTAMI